MRPTAGVTFGGRYELESRIAIGGMGEVWNATDLVIGRSVAIKILKDEYLGDPNFLERFRTEARHAALVNHEGIANVFDYGEEDGSAFLVMELVPGEALSTMLEREHVLSTDKVLDIVAQTAAALQAAHAAGLVHRDIKPGNLLITPDGRVKITDFGIARIADQVPLTATGQVMGTVQYLSPEQASGHAASPTTDIYSLGIVAYECLAGKRPFTGESQVAIAMAQINETPPPLPVTVSEPVRNFVLSMIAKNPADRPASAAHVARAAQSLRQGNVSAATVAVPAIAGDSTPTAATMLLGSDAETALLGTTAAAGTDVPTTTAEVPTSEKKKRSRWTWPLIALIAILAIILTGTVIALVNQDETPPPVETTTSAPVETTAPTEEKPTPEPTQSLIAVSQADFVGLTYDEAAARLRSLGLASERVDGNAASSQDDVGTVYAINPEGNLEKGRVVKVTVYSPMAEIPTPTATPTLSGPACVDTSCTALTAGAEVTVNWAAFTRCPAGSSLLGYRITVEGGTSQAAGGEVSSNTARVTVGTAPGTFSVSYSAHCGQQETGQSPTATAPIQAPTEVENTPVG
ncbi:protein kinase domain-containing protein [Mycetocola zhujimingii]|uniref:protein kinase domain-containing protein n=1 Tax=Mycetocola zhujimingii TaxID=2079792 RepID=UPI000D33EB1D|nr:protein kinase [Mycetocola zhujimingii]AWB85206.1 serine/threonine protein kinase [Mycetocola zhujimingii]